VKAAKLPVETPAAPCRLGQLVIEERVVLGPAVPRLMDMFGLSVETASRYTATVTSTACVQV
jgi:hypothetical protein